MTSSSQPQSAATSAARPHPPALSAVPSLRGSAASRLSNRPNEDFIPDASVLAARDFAYASALIDNAERMRVQPDLPSLLSSVAAEAATLIHADDVAVVRYVGIRRLVLAVHVPSQIDDRTLLEALRAAGEEQWLVNAGPVADLADDPRWASRQGALATVNWRSVMAVPLVSPNSQDQTRLLWFSDTPGAFATQAPVADLFSRQANLAIQDLAERTNLKLAVAARHRVGQAQGILMARRHMTADEAFHMLRRVSQSTNVKLRTIADHIIGEFEPDRRASA